MHEVLQGRWILVVEDQPLIALDIADCLTQSGASVLRATTLQEGLRLAEHTDLSAAILDFGMREGDTSVLCTRLAERGIPFIVYTGYDQVYDACRAGIVVRKPALPDTLVRMVAKFLEQSGQGC
jgi:DNA-binding response OmpR family regulator